MAHRSSSRASSGGTPRKTQAASLKTFSRCGPIFFWHQSTQKCWCCLERLRCIVAHLKQILIAQLSRTLPLEQHVVRSRKALAFLARLAAHGHCRRLFRLAASCGMPVRASSRKQVSPAWYSALRAASIISAEQSRPVHKDWIVACRGARRTTAGEGGRPWGGGATGMAASAAPRTAPGPCSRASRCQEARQVSCSFLLAHLLPELMDNTSSLASIVHCTERAQACSNRLGFCGCVDFHQTLRFFTVEEVRGLVQQACFCALAQTDCCRVVSCVPGERSAEMLSS